MIQTYVLTNNNHLFLLRGFSYLWNEYAGPSSQVVVVGYDMPQFALPSFLRFLSLGKQVPKEKWSNSLIDFCERIVEDYFILLLEDFWLYDYYDRKAIPKLLDWMDDDVLRIDLSGNRASYGHKTLGQRAGYDIIQSHKNAKYQMSFQAAIWRKENLLKMLRRNESPWEAEIKGSKRVKKMKVLGTKPAVMRYQPVWRSQKKQWQLDKIPTYQLEKIKEWGWLDTNA